MTFEKINWDSFVMPITLEALGDPEGRYMSTPLAFWMYSGEATINGLLHSASDLVALMYVVLGDYVVLACTYIRYYIINDEVMSESSLEYIYSPVAMELDGVPLFKGWTCMDYQAETMEEAIRAVSPDIYFSKNNWYPSTAGGDRLGYSETCDIADALGHNGFVTFTKYEQSLGSSGSETPEELAGYLTILNNTILKTTASAGYNSLSEFFTDLAKATQEYIGDTAHKVQIKTIPSLLRGGDTGVEYNTLPELLEGVAKAVQYRSGSSGTIQGKQLPSKIRELINGN